jgi:hypothetical protein
MNQQALAPLAPRRYGLRSSFPLRRESEIRQSGSAVVRTSRPALSCSADDGYEAILAADTCFDQFARCIGATAFVVRRKSLIPCPAGYWIEALPRTLMSRGGGAAPAVAGAGTAFLVTPQHFVTAAHVIDRHWVANAAFVFDFHAACLRQPEGSLPLRYEFAASSVALGAAILGAEAALRGDDITVVELTQPTSRRGIAIATFDELELAQSVAMVGCARLQPMTVVTAIGDESPARVLSFDARIVQTNIDAFQGNSGSALLDASGDVLGVHIGISADDDGTAHGNAPAGEDNDVAVASAVRLRVMREVLVSVGAEIAGRKKN